MLYGTTYIVRPAIDPVNNPRSFCCIFAGSSQLLVGPASSFVREQMNVRSSTRATSAGFERTRMLLGRFCSSSGTAVPDRIMSRSIDWYSSGEPSHQCARSGLHNWAASSTHRARCLGFFSLRDVSTSIVRLDIKGVSATERTVSLAAMQRDVMSACEATGQYGCLQTKNWLRFNFANLILSSFPAAIPSQKPGALGDKAGLKPEILAGYAYARE